MTSFELTCACGRPLLGERQRHHQLVSCPACGRISFVFPFSPYDLPPRKSSPAAPTWWRTPLLTAIGCVFCVLLGFVVAWPYLTHRPLAVGELDAEKVFAERDAGRLALSQGNFHDGRRLLDKAIHWRDRHPTLLSAAQNRELNQLHRQADLLARQLTRHLEEIVRQGKFVRDPDEWAAQFAEYRGRTIILDDRFRHDENGRPIPANDVIDLGDEIVTIAFEDLELLHDLPSSDSPRLIFGARLASCRREDGGKWVIRFEPDSGVFLTDPDLWQACSLSHLDDDTRRVLERQREWLEKSGMVAPARRGP